MCKIEGFQIGRLHVFDGKRTTGSSRTALRCSALAFGRAGGTKISTFKLRLRRPEELGEREDERGTGQQALMLIPRSQPCNKRYQDLPYFLQPAGPESPSDPSKRYRVQALQLFPIAPRDPSPSSTQAGLGSKKAIRSK